MAVQVHVAEVGLFSMVYNMVTIVNTVLHILKLPSE